MNQSEVDFFRTVIVTNYHVPHVSRVGYALENKDTADTKIVPRLNSNISKFTVSEVQAQY